MSDEPRSRSGHDGAEDPLDGAREDAVRRLLADARETGPAPDDVVARLDAALAGLAAPPTPTDLDSRRRGRRWPTALLAAAAVVVVAGVGIGVVVDGRGDEGADSASAPADAPAEGPDREEAEDEGAQDGAADEPGITAESAPPGDPTGDSGAPQQRDDGVPTRLRSGPGLAADVGALLEDREEAPPRMEGFRACAPAYLAAEAVPALLDGARVDLVPTPASTDEVRVTVYPCDGSGTRTLLVPRG